MRSRTSTWPRLFAGVVSLLVAVLLGQAGCAADDLSEYLGGGACDDGKCAPGYVCVKSAELPDGVCKSEGSGGDAGPCASCAAGEICCDDACVDIKTSSAHCGGCGQACPQ